MVTTEMISLLQGLIIVLVASPQVWTVLQNLGAQFSKKRMRRLRDKVEGGAR